MVICFFYGRQGIHTWDTSKAYLPVLKQRSVLDMAMVLQYGVANIVNATLNLLQVLLMQLTCKDGLDGTSFKDEEEEVREAAARFASGLPRIDSKVQLLIQV